MTDPDLPPSRPHLPDGEDEDDPVDLDAELARERADAGIRARRREAALRRQAGESATFLGVLVDLAERSQPLVVTTAAGRHHRGRISGVGTDFAVVRPGPGGALDGGEVVVRLDAVANVRTSAERAPVGDRPTRLDVSMAEVLPAMAEDRPRVSVATVAGEVLTGELRSAGVDVLVVRLDGAGDLAYVPMASVAELIRH